MPRLIFSEVQENQDWVGTLGLSRNGIAHKILRGDWFQHPSPESLLMIEETREAAFTLRYSCFRDEEAKKLKCADATFEIAFNYENQPEDIKICSVMFGSLKYNNMGNGFLYELASTALDSRCKRIFIEPDLEGSPYWTARGAVIQDWPEYIAEFDDRICALLASEKLAIRGWNDVDRHALRAVVREENVEGLNSLVDRDDVTVFYGTRFMPLRRYLFKDVPLGECVFDFDNPITQRRFLSRVGFDIVAERGGRGFYVPAEPVSGAPLRTQPAILAQQ